MPAQKVRSTAAAETTGLEPVGRVVVGERTRGSGFAVAPSLVVTAGHLVRDRGEAPVAYVPEGGEPISVRRVDEDEHLDVALLHLDRRVPAVMWVDRARAGAKWRVTTRPQASDPVLTGTVTDERRRLRSAKGQDVTLTQLLVDQSLGDYRGFSGSPVMLDEVDGGVVGVLVEQARWRTVAGTTPRPAANVLFAVPIEAVIERFRLGRRVSRRPIAAAPEWRCASLGRVEAAKRIKVAAVSADGTTLAVWHRLWGEVFNIATKKRAFVMKRGLMHAIDMPKKLVFSPDARLLAGLIDKGAILWDTQTGEQVEGLQNEISQDIAFSADGRLVAIGAFSMHVVSEYADVRRGSPNVTIWDTRTRREKLTVPREGNGVAFDGRGDTLAIAASATSVHDARTGETIQEFKFPSSFIALSPDGALLATSTKPRALDRAHKIEVWSVQTGERTATLPSRGGVKGLAFDRDGHRLAVGYDASVLVWDLGAGSVLHDQSFGTPLLCFAFTRDGAVIAVNGDGTFASVTRTAGPPGRHAVRR